jgi:hypothetical protein
MPYMAKWSSSFTGRRIVTKLLTAYQGCQIFLSPNIQNVQNIPNGHKIYRMAIGYTKNLPLQVSPTLDFDLKIFHLAVLVSTR